MNRFSIKFTGESGQGINSVGEILLKSLKNSNYYVFGYREYPSLIKGGEAAYQISISSKPVNSVESKVDIMFSISRFSIDRYLKSIKRGGVLVHSINKLLFENDQKLYIEENEIKLIYINADQESILAGGTKLASNVYLMGVLWQLLGLPLEVIDQEVKDKFGKDKKFIDVNEKVLKKGFDHSLELGKYEIASSEKSLESSPILSGNEALSLGAIKAGTRAFYAYPMTPASSILTNLASFASETGMVVKQAEDEITSIQMVLGSMYVGARAFTATSGGGFDLMTESISMAGITEIPLVIVLAQRPGPATGLPTWSAASDLELAIYGGHGEFPRVVLSASDAESSFYLIQDAFNLSEVYQVPVILLTEKNIAESIFLPPDLNKEIPIKRGLLSNPTEESKRYQFTNSGISPRWLPGENKYTYITNSDEHNMDGSSTEDEEVAGAMYEKRMSKLDTLREELPKPIIFGDEECDLLIVGWGSVKSVVTDLINSKAFSEQRVAYLHYEYLYPLNTSTLREYAQRGTNLLLIENNKTMQLGKLIKKESGIVFNKEFGKFNGRPIYSNEIINLVNKMRINGM